MNLKAQLRQFNEMDTIELKKIKIDDLVNKMLEQIGTTDSELRDSLIYSTFVRLINEEILTEQQMIDVLEVCISDSHLFFKIGEENADSVFTRSFSALVVAAIISKDLKSRFLTEAMVMDCFEKSIQYVVGERDVRGFVKGKGWAHSMAHGADLMVAAVGHPLIEKHKTTVCLVAIKEALFKGSVYTDDEDERFLFVIDHLIVKDVEEEKLIGWIDTLYQQLEDVHALNGFSNNIFMLELMSKIS
ncbi:DUF2785 domain-containing protein [Bacillus carboniphilus]|uniref:DUF2785 domain-containing protein n=1 Tax=Bacillus carboniphilus TaxID=86663 RepID=A0ABN0WIG4_9BACI